MQGSAAEPGGPPSWLRLTFSYLRLSSKRVMETAGLNLGEAEGELIKEDPVNQTGPVY